MRISKDNRGQVALLSSPQMMLLMLVLVVVLAIIFFVGITIMSFFLDFFIPVIIIIVAFLVLLGRIPVPYNRFVVGFILLIAGFMFWYVSKEFQTISQIFGGI